MSNEAIVSVDDHGNKVWRLNGKKHRDGDLPACEYHDGTKLWYKNGLRHRDGDKPAVHRIYHGTNGSSGLEQLWYKNDQIHRDYGKPA